MADWRDGAEYAPVERPDGFATPRTAPLEVPPPQIDLAAGAPLQHPDGFQPHPAPVPALEQLVPVTTAARNPQQPFDSSSAMVGEGSAAWGAAHAQAGPTFNPRAPMAVAGWQPEQPLGAPTSSGATFAPPTGAPVAGPMFPAPMGTAPMGPAGPIGAPGAPRSTGNAMIDGAKFVIQQGGWALFGVLLAGVLIRPLSGLLLVAAILLSTRAKVARNRLQTIHGIAAAVAAVGGLFLNQTQDPLTAVNMWSQVMCIILLVLSYLFVQQASAPPPR